MFPWSCAAMHYLIPLSSYENKTINYFLADNYRYSRGQYGFDIRCILINLKCRGNYYALTFLQTLPHSHTRELLLPHQPPVEGWSFDWNHFLFLLFFRFLQRANCWEWWPGSEPRPRPTSWQSKNFRSRGCKD